jgi:CSLREA domain-containing protein
VSVAGLVAGLLAFTATVATAGTTISVDTLADTTGTGDCSLRDAIAAANEDASVGGCPAGSGADTIVFGGLSGTIFLQASLPMVGSEFFSSSVDIDGSGSNVTIDGQGMFSGFRVYQASVDFSDLTVTHMLRAVGAALLVQEGSIVSLVDMILTNNVASFAGGAVHVSSSAPLIVTGSTISGNSAPNGGGITVGADTGGLTLVQSTVSDNTATGVQGGGGIEQRYGHLEIVNSLVSGNHSQGGGGGIWVDVFSDVSITDSRILDNTAAGNGGGIHNTGYSTTVTRSTIAGNEAGTSGGGIQNDDGGQLTVENSTLSDNIAGSTGGGILSASGCCGSMLVVSRSTVSSNQAGSSGGGIATQFAYGESATVRASLIADNTAGGQPQDCLGSGGSLTSGGHNLIGVGDAGCTGFTDGVNNDLVGSVAAPLDPKLGPLAPNGGTTQTHGLLASSPAVDQIPVGTISGAVALCPVSGATDQRGVSRPVGPACDVGAFEGVISTPDPDADDDGIYDEVDTAPATPNVDFDDGDGNFGSITDANGLPITIEDDANAAEGVHIVVGGSGSLEASFNVCGGFTLKVNAGSDVVMTCNSVIVHVLTGEATVELGGGVTVVTVPTGATVEVSDLGGDAFNVDNLGLVDVTVTVDGVETTVEAGEEQQVTAWDFQGFSSPVDNPTVLNVVSSGQAVPLKWRLVDGDGTPITGLASATLHVTSLSCSEGTTADQLEEVASGSSGLHNLGNGYYQFNWKTPKSYAKSCKTLHLDLGEGIERKALFRFPK